MDFLATLTEIENDIMRTIDAMDDAHKLVAYRYLRALGYSTENIEYKIEMTIRKLLKDTPPA